MLRSFDIQGMHCQGCVSRITTALQNVPDVASAKVTLDPPRALVETREPIETQKLAAAVRSAGDYELKESSSESAISDQSGGAKPSLYPLLLIIGYIAGAVSLIALASGDH